MVLLPTIKKAQNLLVIRQMEIFVAASETNGILLEEIVDFDFRL